MTETYIKSEWTPERRRVADRAAAALAAHKGMSVVRFLHPDPDPLAVSWCPPENVDYGRLEQLPVCHVTRVRMRLMYQGEFHWPPHYDTQSLVARIYNARNDDVFYVTDRDEVFEVQR